MRSGRLASPSEAAAVMGAITCGAGYAGSGRLVGGVASGLVGGLGAFLAQRWSLRRRERRTGASAH